MASKIDVTTIKNISEYPNSFKRQGNFPLDLYSLFNTKGATNSTDLNTAEGYAQKSGVAYTGQLVTVSDQSSSNPQPRAYLVRNSAKNSSYLDELALKSEVDSAISSVKSNATPYLSNVQWGGSNKVGSIPAIAAAFDPSLFANRLAYMPTECIQVENSTDGGTTWTAQTVDTGTAFQLTTGVSGASNIKIGGPSVSGNATVDYKTRITISAKSYLYFTARFFNIYVSTNGATGSNCKIETSIDGTTYTSFGTFNIGGWGGWNHIPFQKTFGGSNTSYIKYVRFTFGVTGVETTYGSRLQILKIRAFGETCWNGPSDLAKYGEMYRPISGGAAYFPKDVISSDFRIGDESNSYSLSSRITKRIPITTAQNGSYHRSVIGLCKVSAANSSGGSFAAGQLIFHRNNGLRGTAIATVTCEDAYGLAYGANISITGAMPNSTSIVGCTFTYNGTKWAGVEVYINAAELQNIYFEGEVSDVTNVFGVDYYNVNTSTAINTEINSSIIKAPNSIINYVYNNYYHNGQQFAYMSDLPDLSVYYTKEEADSRFSKPGDVTHDSYLMKLSGNGINAKAVLNGLNNNTMTYTANSKNVQISENIGPKLLNKSGVTNLLTYKKYASDLDPGGLFVPSLQITSSSVTGGTKYEFKYSTYSNNESLTDIPISTITLPDMTKYVLKSELPKDMVVKSGKVVTVKSGKDSDGNATTNSDGTYLRLTINASSGTGDADTYVYINVNDLADIDRVEGKNGTTVNVTVSTSDAIATVSAEVKDSSLQHKHMSTTFKDSYNFDNYIKYLSGDITAYGGFKASNDAEFKNVSGLPGVVIGHLAKVTLSTSSPFYGVVLGQGAEAQHSYGVAIGCDTTAWGRGGAIGRSAASSNGLAGGYAAAAADGFAGGENAIAGNGVAAGLNAQTKQTLSSGAEMIIDAIQLGTGTNSEIKSFQVYDYQIMHPNGTINLNRLSNVFDGITSVKDSSGNITSYTGNLKLSSLMNILNKDTEGNYTFKAGLMPSSGVNVETANGLAIWRFEDDSPANT